MVVSLATVTVIEVQLRGLLTVRGGGRWWGLGLDGQLMFPPYKRGGRHSLVVISLDNRENEGYHGG